VEATPLEQVRLTLDEELEQTRLPLRVAHLQRLAEGLERPVDEHLEIRRRLRSHRVRAVNQDLDDALRSATKAKGIARAGRLLASREQADDRIELVSQRDRRPRRRGLAELRARRRRILLDAHREVVVVNRLPYVLRLLLGARVDPAHRALQLGELA